MRYLQIFVVIGVLLCLPWVIWLVKEEKPMSIFVVNKAVSADKMTEHIGLFWVLEHLKITKIDGTSYKAKVDFYNGSEDHSTGNAVSTASMADADLIYLANTYGQSEEDPDRGLQAEEWASIKKAVNTQGARLVMEYDVLASTADEIIREEASAMAGVQRTGWSGKAFKELSSDSEEVPRWAIENFEKEHSSKWDFSGYGLIFTDEQTGKIEVFSEKEDQLKGDALHLAFTKEGQATFDLTSSTYYDRWFEVVKPAGLEEDVLAEFSLGLTQEGKDRAAEIGLGDLIPAIVSNRNTTYFAGDFTEVHDVPKPYKYAGYAKVRNWLSFTDKDADKRFYWNTYVPVMTKLLTAIHSKEKEGQQAVDAVDYEKVDATQSYSARIKDNRFELYEEGKWVPQLVKGVNMGMGKPGSFPGEAAITRAEYDRWFKQIGQMNANMIRVYTLHPPAFYEALLAYNQTHEKKLHILHGVWADEAPLEETLDAFTPEIVETFETEMKRITDVIHGNATVEPRPGHASGTYTADISPYVSGWVLGIEWYPFMVDHMKTKYADKPQFEGQRIRTEKAEGFELWLAERMDNLLIYEKEKYDWTRPISFTNWVTTDHLDQQAEPSEQEDMASVNPDHLLYVNPEQEAGMFASYHVYPYYPDFLNLEEKYTEFIDHRGEKNNYAGYLRDLHDKTETPILIAEFGIPGSRGMTHENVSGWNQGFHSETEQGTILTRLYEDIVEEELMGGLVFTWQDEWFKRTWNTMELDDPDRRPFWSNVQTNEQNFGLLSFNSMKIVVDGETADWEGVEPSLQPADGAIEKLYVDHDEAYLYVRADLRATGGKWLDGTNAHLFLDVLPGKGSATSQHLPSVRLDSSSADFHFALNSKKDSHAYVEESYDPFLYTYGVQLGMYETGGKLPANGSGIFNPIRFALNKQTVRPDTGEVFPFSYYETGKLRYGNGNPESGDYDSLTDFAVSNDGKVMELRIPWLLVNIKDPSTKTAMGDFYTKAGLQSKVTIDSIGITLVAEREDTKELLQLEPIRYAWEKWELPEHGERLKKSYDLIQKLFEGIN